MGSNLGVPRENVLKAFALIQKLTFVFDAKLSSLYQTSPISDIPQEDYMNAVCFFETKCTDPFYVLDSLQDIERLIGKKEKAKNAPRIIDIDLLIFEGHYIQSDRLELPHPRMLQRLFVLKPLLELVGEQEIWGFSVADCKKLVDNGTSFEKQIVIKDS